MISFKEYNLLGQFNKIHPKLRDLFEYVYDFITNNIHKDLVITELYRSDEDHRKKLKANNVSYYSTPHSTIPIRAMDMRSWTFTQDEIRLIGIAVNDNWQYNNSKYKCFVYHKLENGVFHIHLQVHDDTKQINNFKETEIEPSGKQANEPVAKFDSGLYDAMLRHLLSEEYDKESGLRHDAIMLLFLREKKSLCLPTAN